MEGLLRLSRPQYRDPLIIAEFYNAVQALPDPDKTRAIRALWDIGDACDCNSEDRLNLLWGSSRGGSCRLFHLWLVSESFARSSGETGLRGSAPWRRVFPECYG
jgi:hypothetical protein